ncbi:MAG: CvpA family protein [Tannerella sp.]|jgi:membrane protein required for colicin V production|nr:CvpA family protein [Tannerella sp.]
MNWLDIVLVVLIVAGFVKGYTDGFIRQVVFFFALIAAIYLCSKGAVNLRGYVVQTGWFPEETITLVSSILAFIMIAGIITLAGWIIHKMISATPLSLFNHIAGALLGLVVTMLILSLTLNVLEVLDRRSALISPEMKVESRFYFYFKDLVPAIYPADLFIWHEEEVEE